MATSFEIKTNSKQLNQKFKNLRSIFPRIIEKGVKQAGFQLLDIIRTKTLKGIDFRGKPFAPYSEGYIKHLEKKGYSTRVDLFYSGKMLGALTPDMVKKTGKYKVTLGFARAEERDKALWNQVLGKPKREFFGFNDRTKSIIQKSFNKFVEKELRKFNI